MNRVSLGRLGLILILGFLLAGCTGQAPMTAWPGLAATDSLAYVAAHQQVYAVNISGDNYSKEAWKFPTTADAGSVGSFSASPAVSADVLVVAAEGPTSSYSGAVFGLNPQTGQQLWCLALDSKAAERLRGYSCQPASDVSPTVSGFFGLSLATPQDNRVMDHITVAGGVAYFGLNNGKVYAVDALTGKAKWTAPFRAEQAVWAAPVLDPATGLLYVGSLDHHFYALDAATGTVKWKKALGAAVAAAPTLADGTLYVGTFGAQVLALQAADGAERWTFETANWVWGTPVLDAGTLYFTDVSGNVYALTAATGKEIWSAKPGNTIRAAPVVTADAIIVTDRAGHIFGLNPATGASVWPALPALKGQLLGSPVVGGDTVLVAPLSGDNLLVAYSPAGAQLWAFAPTQGK